MSVNEAEYFQALVWKFIFCLYIPKLQSGFLLGYWLRGANQIKWDDGGQRIFKLSTVDLAQSVVTRVHNILCTLGSNTGYDLSVLASKVLLIQPRVHVLLIPQYTHFVYTFCLSR